MSNAQQLTDAATLRGDAEALNQTASSSPRAFGARVFRNFSGASTADVGKYALELHVDDLRDPSPANERVHLHAIEALAREAQVPVGRVSDIYSAELKRLMTDARVKEYLPVLTMRKVKVILRGEAKPRQAG